MHEVDIRANREPYECAHLETGYAHVSWLTLAYIRIKQDFHRLHRPVTRFGGIPPCKQIHGASEHAGRSLAIKLTYAYTIKANAFLPSFNLAWVISFDKVLHWKKLGRARKGGERGEVSVRISPEAELRQTTASLEYSTGRRTGRHHLPTFNLAWVISLAKELHWIPNRVRPWTVFPRFAWLGWILFGDNRGRYL